MTVSSSTDIGNLAQDLLGGEVVVDIETPSTTVEATLGRWYHVSRRKLLREHPWNFASKRAILSASGSPEFGYSSKFLLPTDFIRVNSLSDADNYPISNEYYEIEDGHILYDADAGELRLKYVYDITNVAQFDTLFVDLLAIDIALAMAFRTTSSNTDVARLTELRKQRAAMSKSIDGQERPPTRRQVSRARNARLSATNTLPHRVVFE